MEKHECRILGYLQSIWYSGNHEYEISGSHDTICEDTNYKKGYRMRIGDKFFLAAAIAFSCSVCHAQTIAGPYEVGTWPGFRSAAVAHTFDDNDLKRVLDILGIKED